MLTFTAASDPSSFNSSNFITCHTIKRKKNQVHIQMEKIGANKKQGTRYKVYPIS